MSPSARRAQIPGPMTRRKARSAWSLAVWIASTVASLVGPVRKIGGSIEKAMGREHCNEQDCTGEFTSSNGVTKRPNLEREFVEKPIAGKKYPERFEPGGSRCRCACTREELVAKMEDKNATLSESGHSELIVEEAMAATLYTGPMYHKYNLVLRAKTGKPFLKERFDNMFNGNVYASTLHGINSFIVKMSKITSACTLWRGSTQAN
ncbi:unnamed protein product [Prorocentrum cordatum]|uniref:Uncharacterized protein n=1 Tax=Prorocentrum cordatum TaxID=2364126 RepID=A0ABN9VAW6_9DINO|nr:unnamed protein product [Polarella glacialis]